MNLFNPESVCCEDLWNDDDDDDEGMDGWMDGFDQGKVR